MNTPLPCATCGGKCCHAAGFTQSELRAARLEHGGHYPPGARVVAGIPIQARHGGGMAAMVVVGDDLRCAFFADGRCSIYEVRPKPCRDYGTVDDLPCQELYPERAVIAADRLFRKLVQIKEGR